MVVGLGNPGAEYARTRHNAGFRVVERVAERVGARFRDSRQAAARCAAADLPGGRRVVLVEPMTFMNESGTAVAALLRWHRWTLAELLLVYDDVDLPLGTIRIRPRGGAGGHRGTQSVIDAVGGDEFPRVRVGIGRDAAGRDTVAHVLSIFDAAEVPVAEAAFDRAADAVVACVTEGVDRAMNRFNAEPKEIQQP